MITKKHERKIEITVNNTSQKGYLSKKKKKSVDDN